MKRKLWIWIALTAALTAVPSAYAQMGQRQMRGARDDSERSLPPQRLDPAQRDMLPPRRESPETGRMSAEERRQLRRDIDDAGRELYRRKPPHARP